MFSLTYPYFPSSRMQVTSLVIVTEMPRKAAQGRTDLLWLAVRGDSSSWCQAMAAGAWGMWPLDVHCQETEMNAAGQFPFPFHSKWALIPWSDAHMQERSFFLSKTSLKYLHKYVRRYVSIMSLNFVKSTVTMNLYNKFCVRLPPRKLRSHSVRGSQGAWLHTLSPSCKSLFPLVAL